MLRKGLQQPGHQRARVPSPFRSGARSAIGDVAGRKWMEVTPSPMTRTTEFHRGPALHQKKTFRCAAYLSVVLPFVPRLGIPLSMLLSAFALPGPPYGRSSCPSKVRGWEEASGDHPGHFRSAKPARMVERTSPRTDDLETIHRTSSEPLLPSINSSIIVPFFLDQAKGPAPNFTPTVLESNSPPECCRLKAGVQESFQLSSIPV